MNLYLTEAGQALYVELSSRKNARRELRRFGNGMFKPVALLPDGITAVCGAEDRACEGSVIECYNTRNGEEAAAGGLE